MTELSAPRFRLARWRAWLLPVGLCLGVSAASAQGLRLGTGNLPGASGQPATAAGAVAARPADHIVAVVNSEPITNNDVRARMARIEVPPGGSLPPPEELARQVLERLITERTQLQHAAELGLRVDDAAVNQAEASIAARNQISVETLHARLREMGLEPSRFREDLRRDILLQRVRENQVDRQVRVTERDIDDHLRERQNTTDLTQIELNLAQVLVQVPENADAATVARLQARAADLARRARSGADFAALARESSDAPERASGGLLGLRTADRYPSLFVNAVRTLKVGDVTDPVRSPAGFHILKVVEKRVAGLPETHLTQTRARHILLRPGPQLDESAAQARLAEMRQRVLSGQASFESLAREHSQDGSAAAGGDLGWARPGQFVPEFEQVMNRLEPGQVSDPVVSRFGVHLIQVVERQRVELSTREQREWVRSVVRERKAEEAYADWARELRARAYVEYREPPQ
jgi:peptidyl-prolyl cis-trans isomerase SurA